MKVILLILFVSNQGYANERVTETLQYETPTMAHCESLVENLNEIFEVDPALSYVKISMNCLEIPK